MSRRCPKRSPVRSVIEKKHNIVARANGGELRIRTTPRWLRLGHPERAHVAPVHMVCRVLTVSVARRIGFEAALAWPSGPGYAHTFFRSASPVLAISVATAHVSPPLHDSRGVLECETRRGCAIPPVTGSVGLLPAIKNVAPAASSQTKINTTQQSAPEGRGQ